MATHAESEGAEVDWFGVMLCTFFVLILSTAFMIGRFSHGAPSEVRANVQEAGVQKDEALVPPSKKSRGSSKRSCDGATKQRSPALLHVKPEWL